MENIFIGGEPEKVEAPIVEKTEKLKDTESIGTENTEGIDPPLPLYQEAKGVPYSVKYFNIDIWEALTPMLDVDHIRDKVDQIEQFVQDEITIRKYENTIESYREIMDKLLSGLHLSPNELPDSKVNKASKFIELVIKQRDRENFNKKIRKTLGIQEA